MFETYLNTHEHVRLIVARINKAVRLRDNILILGELRLIIVA